LIRFLTTFVASFVLLASVAFGQMAISSCPYSIITSGSYIVTADLNYNSSSACININANDVIVDLGGHTLTLTGGSGIGIYNSGGSGIVIINGNIIGFDTGIQANAGAFLANLAVQGSSGDGVITDVNVVLKNVDSNHNGGRGYVGSGLDIITSSHFNDNGGNGAELNTSATVVDSEASNNGGVGFIGNRGTILYSIAKRNTSDGIVMGNYSGSGVPPSLVDNRASHNGGYGLNVGCATLGLVIDNILQDNFSANLNLSGASCVTALNVTSP
jgi:hypothetical protein